MTWLALLSVALGAEVHLQPGTASPGDAVLVTVKGADQTPSGTLGDRELSFLPFHGGYQALDGLSVEADAGAMDLSVALVSNGEEQHLEGTLEVLPASFRKSEITVSKRFTSPSKRDREWSARDQRAFAEAFDVELEPFLFSAPFEWPRLSVVTAPFGDRRLFNGKQQSQHYGLDLDGRTGAPIRAANDGEVVMARECFGSGNTVLIHHGGKLFTAYFHLSKFEVKRGATVKRGQLLGLVGKTGRVTGPHLHFGAKIDGRWVNAASLYALDFDD